MPPFFQSPFATSSGGFESPFKSPLGQKRQLLSTLAALPPEQQQAFLTQLEGTNLQDPPEESGDESLVGRLVPNIVEKTVSQVAEAALYTIPGLVHTGTEIGRDIADTLQGAPTLKRTAALGEQMAGALAEDFRNPGENPGYLLMDLVGLASMGAGTAGRLSAASRKFNEGMAARNLPPPPPPTGPIGYMPPGTRPPGGAPPALARTELEDISRTREPGLFRDIEGPAPETLGGDPGIIQRIPSREPPPLSQGHLYRVLHRSGERYGMTGHFIREGTKGGKPYLFFRDQKTGKTRSVSKDAIADLRLEERAESSYAFPTGGLRPEMTPSRPYDPALPLTPQPLPESPRPSRIAPAAAGAVHGEGGRFTGEKAIPETPAETVAAEAAVERAATRRPAADEPLEQVRFQAQKGGHMISEPLPDGSRVGVKKVAERNFAVLVIGPDGTPQRLHTVVDAPNAMRLAQETAETMRGGKALDAPEPPTAVTVPLPTETGRMPSYGITRETLPDVPEQVARDVAGEIQSAWLESGKKLSRQTHLAILQKHLGEGPGQEVFQRYYRMTGGQDIGMRQVIGDTLRALKERPQPGTRRLRIFEADPAGLTPREMGPSKRTTEGYTQTGTWQEAEVLLSRNPLVRSFQNAQMDYLERGGRTLGPFGKDLAEKISHEQGEMERVMRAAETSLADLERVAAEAKLRPSRKGFGAIVDTMNMGAKLAALYFKPGYVPPNLLGQVLINMAHHSWNPVRVMKAVRLQNAIMRHETLGPERAGKIKRGMQEGLSRTLGYEQGISPRFANVYSNVVEFYNKFLDTPFRDNAFISEAMRHGFDTPEKIARLVDSDTVAMQSKFREITRRANKDAIDFGNLNNFERDWVRRAVFFYPWFKGASIYAAHFASEHPGQALLSEQMGRQGQEHELETLGPLPSYLRGVIPFGESEVPGLGKVPRIINPRAATVLGTPGEVLETGLGFLLGGKHAESSAALSNYLTPAISGLIASATRTDPFTGAEFPASTSGAEIFGGELLDTLAVKRAVEQGLLGEKFRSGEQDPSEFLNVSSPLEAAGRWTFGISPYSINPREARSRAFAEARSLEDKRTREIMLHRDYRERFAEAGRTTGSFQELPSDLGQAFAARAQREAEIAAHGESLGRDLTQLDRLQADVQLLVRRGIMDEGQGRQLLANMASQPESAIRSLRRRYGDAYFGVGLIGRYRALLNARGATLSVP